MKRKLFSVYLSRNVRLPLLARPALLRSSFLRSAVAALIGCVALGTLTAPGSALAASVQYQLASVDVELNDSGLGLQLFADTSVLDTSVFTLDDFQSKELSAFKVGTTESGIDFDDLFPRSITATFTFAAPGDAQAVVKGKSFGQIAFFQGFGIVKWGLPDLVYTPDATFLVGLSDTKFELGDDKFKKSKKTKGGSSLVNVKIKQLKSKAPAPVPEPASVALLLIGGAVVGLGIRRGRTRIEK